MVLTKKFCEKLIEAKDSNKRFVQGKKNFSCATPFWDTKVPATSETEQPSLVAFLIWQHTLIIVSHTSNLLHAVSALSP